MIRAAVFDLWNTLVHSRHGSPFQHLRQLMTPSQMEHFADMTRDAMVQPHADSTVFLERWRYTLGLEDSQVGSMGEAFRLASADAELYPEVMDALLKTRNLARLAVLSNTQSFDMDFIERLGLDKLVHAWFLSAKTGYLKPDIQAFEQVQKKLCLFPGELVMVGDDVNDDLLGAHRAGWTVILVNRSGAAHADLELEDWVEVPDLSLVPQAIENLQAGARCSTCLG